MTFKYQHVFEINKAVWGSNELHVTLLCNLNDKTKKIVISYITDYIDFADLKVLLPWFCVSEWSHSENTYSTFDCQV